MTTTKSRSLSYLIATGFFLGVSSNLAKVSGNLRISPVAFLAWSCLGGGCVLWLNLKRTRIHTTLNFKIIQYFGIAGLISIALPNIIFFPAVNYVGAGFVSLAISLPPLLTYLLSLIFKLQKWEAKKFLGVCFALMGGGWMSLSKWGQQFDQKIWIILTLTGPLFLACGNIYRTMKWPSGAKPQALAPGVLIFSSILVFLLGLIFSQQILISFQYLWLVGIQSLVFSFQYICFFKLQEMSGPVYLSFVGSVAAIIGIPIAVFALGESLPPGLIPSSALIIGGIIVFNMKERKV